MNQPPSSAGRVAGIDYGVVRIGIALSNPERTIASPLENYTRRTVEQDAKRFRRLVDEERVSLFVVGLPIHLDGGESPKSLEARRFGQWLGETTGVAVEFFDERFTSVEAEQFLLAADLTRKSRKKRRDMLAAQIMLNAYLESQAMNDVPTLAKKIITNVEKVIVGKRRQIVLSLVSWFCGGHVLLEDVPGVAKTMLARALARSVGCSFKRIQCTPDLLPTDVTGVSVFNQKTAEFEFRPGPIFAQVVLADEINRATPRTQAAMLEAMAEGRVTVDGVTRVLQPPFWVIATQNPIDHEGTFPLPEAQLDRFLVRFSLGYPNMEEELKMLELLERDNPLDRLEPVVSVEELLAVQQAVRTVHVDPKVRLYIAQIVQSSRQCDDVALGGSPRATLALFRTSQALAAVSGRNFVRPDDVKQMSGSVLTHRVILRPESRLRKLTAAAVVAELVAEQRVPMLPGDADVSA